MDWIQSKFAEPSVQPSKKRRLESARYNSGFQSSIGNLKTVTQSENVSWIDKYKPTAKSELIVNKKKVEEVESWLHSVSDEGAKVLLLSGPPGSGKLTTLKVLCQNLKIQISEWITPPPQEYDSENFTVPYCNQQRSFEEFLIRASRYTSVLSSSSTKRLVVVKDIPNVFTRNPPTFHEFLLKYKKCDGISVIFIITENSLILDLFPEGIKDSLKIKTVNFNPITKKCVNTILSAIIRKERLSSSGSLELNTITEISETCDGDLRNAIMSLNFISTKGASFQVLERKTRLKAKATKEGSSTLKQLLTDPSIDLFHSLGRVLYAKRNDNGQLSSDPNSIVDSFTSNPNTFINMLQENYLSIFSDINSVSRAASFLSLSDFLLHDMNDTLLSRDLSLSVAVRGLMHTNRAPIKKFQQFGKSKNFKVTDLSKSYKDCIKANFYSSNPSAILLDSVTYLNKMSKSLQSDAQRNLIKELSCFYLIEKNC